MTQLQGMNMVEDIFKKIVVHPDFDYLYHPKLEVDDINGVSFGFGYKRKKLSEILRHEGEVEIYYVGYYWDNKEVNCTFENNGHTYEVTSAEIFNS